jgi:hypothetical protein
MVTLAFPLAGAAMVIFFLWNLATVFGRIAPGENPLIVILILVPGLGTGAFLFYPLHRGQSYRGGTVRLMEEAEQGDPAACLRLAEAYLGGDAELHRDLNAGRHWLTRAAEGGNAVAMVRLAELLQEGRGGPRDEEQAMAWLLEARRLGRPIPRMKR